MVRGFLNDGKIDYKSHHAVDSLAFGHCAYAYRNLGRLSQIRISQDHHNFKVEIDGHTCFESDKVQLPSSYGWGITGVSAETADSFEINSLKITTHTADFVAHNKAPDSHAASDPPVQEIRKSSFLGSAAPLNDLPEVDASKIKSEEQFADLHNRLQSLNQHINANHQDVIAGARASSDKIDRIEQLLHNTPRPVDYSDTIERLREKLEALEIRMQHVQNAVGDTWHIEDLKRTVEGHHYTLLKKAPGLGMVIFIVLGGQVLLVGTYVAYKRRRANGPKKYL
jgi:mannose-binding lectin 1